MSEQYNTQPAGLEKKLDEMYKKWPQLPEGFKKWLANNVWWLALIGAILSALSVLSAWNYATKVSQVSDVARSYGVDLYYGESSTYWWLMMAASAVEAVLLFMAFQKLKEHKKEGWNLLFYTSLVSIGALVVVAFFSASVVGTLIGAAIGALISWFFLFSIRSKFTK